MLEGGGTGGSGGDVVHASAFEEGLRGQVGLGLGWVGLGVKFYFFLIHFFKLSFFPFLWRL